MLKIKNIPKIITNKPRNNIYKKNKQKKNYR